ncbi:hypothetical protein GE061_005386 [Apolygus lucorum]|uniref:Ig-like domain-containing protein n=1 Tax=Apolygus lucorum TaxID=248454 RepID=A0A8S9WXI7_APOLU|nr:hypothetical protein GE061_005386 [Apolygus lucorum]
MEKSPVGIYVKKYEWSGSQEAGDCSLWVRAATLEFDDGEWECQVTASDFTTQDALTSTPVRLVVRGFVLGRVDELRDLDGELSFRSDVLQAKSKASIML